MSADAATDHPERLDPRAEGGRLVAAEHLGRYWWAAAQVAEKTVLDAGCGIGYGTRLLAQGGAQRVTGVDIAADALREAEAQPLETAEYVEGDIQQLPFHDDSFDVVVCFEAIEHVPRPEEALDELARVLRPGGRLLVSSPNRGVYPPGNPHHIHEYTAQELEESLTRRFGYVHAIRQHAWLASALLDDSRFGAGPDAAPALTSLRKVIRAEPGQETFALAAASTEPFDTPDSLVALGDAFEVGWWQDQIAELHGQLADSERRRLAAEDERTRLDEQVARLGRELLELEGRIARFGPVEQRLREETARADTLEQHLEKAWNDYNAFEQRMQDLLNAMQSSFSWRVTRPLRTAKQKLLRG